MVTLAEEEEERCGHTVSRQGGIGAHLGELGALDDGAVEHVKRRDVLVAPTALVAVVLHELRRLVDGAPADQVVLLELFRRAGTFGRVASIRRKG